MTWLLKCECGAEFTAASEDHLVRAVEAHLTGEHPALRTLPERGDLLAMAQEVEDGEVASWGRDAAGAADGGEVEHA
ncbi:MAG TPA: DUF1059 domain-containing protein [Solirubrobacterales bacterium]|nr:DUF1059 domain-containing protein [Solirubrobacterales bacterium]